MATTALKILNRGVESRMLFMTAPTPTGVDVDVYSADENYLPFGSTSLGVDPRDEATYHIELRKQAIEHNHFVPDYSSNPEWTPGYVEEIDDAEIITEENE